MIITNYLHLSPLLSLSILPVMVLCIPLSVPTIPAMLIAFVTGGCIDLLAEGVWGLNTAAIVPVAFMRKFLVSAIFGKDHIIREENFSFRKNGSGKIILAITIVQSIFLLIYILVDGAQTRPFLFNLLRFAISLAAGIIVSIGVATVITPDDRR